MRCAASRDRSNAGLSLLSNVRARLYCQMDASETKPTRYRYRPRCGTHNRRAPGYTMLRSAILWSIELLHISCPCPCPCGGYFAATLWQLLIALCPCRSLHTRLVGRMVFDPAILTRVCPCLSPQNIDCFTSHNGSLCGPHCPNVTVP